MRPSAETALRQKELLGNPPSFIPLHVLRRPRTKIANSNEYKRKFGMKKTKINGKAKFEKE